MSQRTLPGLLVFIVALLFPPFIAAQEQGEQPASPAFQKFDPTRDAAADIQTAITEATHTHRRILLDVGGEWCIWCRRLDSLYASHKNLADFLTAHYVVVKVNYSKENKNESLLSKYPKIPGYPHYFVLKSNGELLHSQDTGALESGKGHDPAKVLAFLKKWSE